METDIFCVYSTARLRNIIALSENNLKKCLKLTSLTETDQEGRETSAMESEMIIFCVLFSVLLHMRVLLHMCFTHVLILTITTT